MRVAGSCHCGAIRFTAEIDPKRVGICHCTDCQTFGSSAFRLSTLVPEDDFVLQAGTPAKYVKTAESGARRELFFCPACGTHLWGAGEQGGRVFYSVRVGTLAQRAELAPVAQLWTRSALPWLGSLPALTGIETQ